MKSDLVIEDLQAVAGRHLHLLEGVFGTLSESHETFQLLLSD